MSTWFPDVTIRSRIAVGYLSLLLIFLVMGTGYLGSLNDFVGDFLEYEEHARDSAQVTRISEQVADLRRRVLQFRDRSGFVTEEAVREIYDSLTRSAHDLIESRRDDARFRDDLASQFEQTLLYLDDNLKNMQESRDRRDESVTAFREALAAIRTEVWSAMESAGSSEAVDRLKNAYVYLARVETIALDYLLRQDYRLREEAHSFLDRAASESLTPVSGVASPAQARTVAGLRESVDRIGGVFSKMVQEDRYFNQLVNVVIAGYTEELVKLSEMLTGTADRRQAEIFAAITAEQQATQRYLLTGGIVSLLIAVFVGTATAGSIVRPLASIAETFSRLARGEKIPVVPGQDRRDEIGELSRSAEVFRESNERTEELLKHAQEVTETLRRSEDALRKSNEELDKFAYVASHDLKSPLRAIDSLATWIQEDCYDVLPPKSRVHLAKMQGRIARMERLLADILEYSRVGRQDTPRSAMTVDDAIDDALELLDLPTAAALERGGTSLPIVACRQRLVQVLHNLMGNAIKYARREDLVLRVSVEPAAADCIEIVVTDNGPGIESSYAERIFEMFQTLQSRDEIESTGIGLAIVRKLVQGEGGEVWLDTGYLAGARFRFTWPRAPRQGKSVDGASRKDPLTEADSKRPVSRERPVRAAA